MRRLATRNKELGTSKDIFFRTLFPISYLIVANTCGQAVHGQLGRTCTTAGFIRSPFLKISSHEYNQPIYTHVGVQNSLATHVRTHRLFSVLTDYLFGLYTLYTGLMVTTTMYINKTI